jgi:integrase
MPKRLKDPSYRLHKQSGQAIVTVPDGLGGRHDVLLGPYGSETSRDEYNRVLAEWKANGRRWNQQPGEGSGSDLTVVELTAAYWRHVQSYYVKDGRPTSEQDTIVHALRFVKRLYGTTPANAFGPLALKTVRQAMIDHPITRTVKVKDPATGEAREEVRLLRQGLARRFINKQVGRIKRMFAWAVEEELLPAAVYQALACVKGLKKGKSAAREKARVKPVAEEWIEATLPVLPAVVRTMVEVQRLSGCRPQDVVQMRAIDIDMSAPVWEYRPSRYKTEHHNEDDDPDRERIVFLGPRAQALLKPYLTLNVTDYLFSPKRSEAERSHERREKRKTPLWPSHIAHQATKKAKRPRPAIRDRYDVDSYRRAIRRACLKAGVPVWFPLQLRHTRGTEIRKRYGLEASQAVLGHSEVGVTQVYAESNQDAARRVMLEVG